MVTVTTAPRLPPASARTLVNRIEVAGLDVPNVNILAELRVQYGRTSIDGQAEPGVAEFTILDDVSNTWRQHIEVGQHVAIWGASMPQFRGRISDLELTTDKMTGGSTIRVTAVGPLADANRTYLTTTGWPVESVRDRINRIETASGLPIRIEMSGDGPLVAAGADDANLSVNTLLEQLAVDAGAVVFDSPGGAYPGNLDLPAVIVFQAITYRSTWDVYQLDEFRVLLAPSWVRALSIANRVVVEYRPTATTNSHVVVSDASSIATYGRHDELVTTDVTTEAAARARGNDRLARRGRPYWLVTECVYLRTQWSSVRIGQRVGIAPLPAGAPRKTWAPVVEGYTHIVEGDEVQTVFVLSDPRASYLTDKWQDTQARTWDKINQTISWLQAIDVQDLD